jgi:hypothetical protein
LSHFRKGADLFVVAQNVKRATARPIIGIATVLGCAFCSLSAGAAEAFYVLTERGKDMGRMYTAGPVTDLRFTVDLQGDVPVATYVWAVVGGSERRMRTNEGYWLPWNGDVEKLVDNHLPVVDGKVVFKVLDENVSRDNFGISIGIGYSTGGTAIKYGSYAILPDSSRP